MYLTEDTYTQKKDRSYEIIIVIIVLKSTSKRDCVTYVIQRNKYISQVQKFHIRLIGRYTRMCCLRLTSV